MTDEVPKFAAHPEDLPQAARDLWPNISKWPTDARVRDFLDRSRTRLSDRADVVAGLRWCVAADIGPAWSWFAAWLAVIGISLTIAIAKINVWGSVGLTAVVSIALFILLSRLGSITERHMDRKRWATIWLSAIEEAVLNEDRNRASAAPMRRGLRRWVSMRAKGFRRD